MIFPCVAALVFTLATLVPVCVASMVLLLLKRPQRRFWRISLWLHAALFLLHLVVTFPLALGLLGSRGLGTRPDERRYEGPRLGADGKLLLQSRDSLKGEAQGDSAVGSEILAAARARARTIASSQGVVLRAFRIEPLREPPVAAVVLVHGLFRGAMELEPVAAMLRERGCECWLLELRNHGGSSRAPFTGGLRESDDVVAAVEYVRAQPGRADTPVVLYGISLGTAAVSLALPRLQGIAGLVLDAPIDDLQAAAHRMLSFQRGGDRRSWFAMVEPWRSLVLEALGAWSGFQVKDVAPGEVLANLPHDLPVLLISAGEDDRVPPATVEQLFARLPMPDEKKELWIAAGAHHGEVSAKEPAAYADALARLLARLRLP
ncbi:MAG TPA: alpha/beta fold hydrolase [Planctomycetota bacterium]|nr:alpha/beta fold hydrolase [Planctomycetota bacterium]